MNFKTTIVLLSLLIVLGAVAFFVQKGERSPDAPAPTEQTLVQIPSADVTKLTVESADGKRLVAERSGAAWKLLEPVQAAADAPAIDRLVNSLTGLKSRGQIKLSAAESAASGLDQPPFRIELTGRNGKVVKIAVGSRSGVGGDLYVKLDGADQPEVVPADVYDQLDKSFTSFRQMKLVDVAAADIKQIEITRPDGKIRLAKNGEEWQITGPQAIPGDSNEVSNLTVALSGLTAAEYVNESDVLPMLLPAKSPQLTVWFSTQAPTTQPSATQPTGTTVRFGGYDSILKSNVYVSVSDPDALAKVAVSSLESLNKKSLDLRDRKVVDIDPKLVSRIEIATDIAATTQPTTKPASHSNVIIERRRQSLALGPELGSTQPTAQAATQPATAPAKPPSEWVLKSAADADATAATVDALLEKVHPLRAQRYLEKAPATQPAATYQLTIITDIAGKSTTHQIKLVDGGVGNALTAEYNGVSFEADHSLIDAMAANFAGAPN